MLTADAFLQELQRLLSLYPKRPTKIVNSVNSEYGHNINFGKNLYHCFDVTNSSDTSYTYDSFMANHCFDCDYAVESELCYEGTDVVDSYNSDYIDFCQKMTDSAFSNKCYNCQNVFGCYGLKNKSFCIFNRQLTQDEYSEKLKEYRKWPIEKVLEEVENLKKRFPLTQTNGVKNENSNYGNYQYFNKDCYMCFDAAHNDNCVYMFDAHKSKNCLDNTQSGTNELCYEIVDCANCYNSAFSAFSYNCNDSWFVFDCINVKDCIGVTNMNHAQYCILNRQLSKEDYERLSQELLKDIMSKNLGWADLEYFKE
jgi:hypothetical protein